MKYHKMDTNQWGFIYFSKKKSFEMMELSSKSVIFVEKICRSVNKKAEVFAKRVLGINFWQF